MPEPAAEIFARATELIVADGRRTGNCLHFGTGDRILLAGDIHGHKKNLAKIVHYADLGANPSRRLILQEVIHGCESDAEGSDRSVELLLRVARLKISRPEQVFILMGNHDVAQFADQEITKNGRGMCEAFLEGLSMAFGQGAEEVCAAVNGMLRCLPLVARCENGMLLSHSLPTPGRMQLVDWEILNRHYCDDDFKRGGSVYEFTWGRGHTPEQLAELAERLDARQFILGHQPVETGYVIQHERLVILASNHSHGVVMEFDADQAVADEKLPKLIRPIVAL